MKKITQKKVLLETGFTLIELLIVIVIIGILSGILISVIDPTSQQNRARDANVRATMNKIALSTSGYVSAYGRIPAETEFGGGLNAFSDYRRTCRTAGTANCIFTLTNQSMPATCRGDWYGVGTRQCHFYYCGGADSNPGDGNRPGCTWSSSTTAYRIYAKAWGSINMFMYNSADSVMYLCDQNGANCTAAGS